MQHYLTMCESIPVSGTDSEYLNWYLGEHLHDLVQFPAFCGGRLYRIDEEQIFGTLQDQKYRYMMLVDWKAETVDEIYSDLRRLTEGGHLAPAMAVSDPLIYTYVPVTRYVMGQRISGMEIESIAEYAAPVEDDPQEIFSLPAQGSRSHSMVVLSNPVGPETEKEFLHWYRGQHMHDLLRVPGFVGGRLYKALDPQYSGPLENMEYRYMIVWDWETDSLQSVFSDIKSRIDDGRTVFSEAVQRVFEHIIVSPAVEYVSREELAGKSVDEIQTYMQSR